MRLLTFGILFFLVSTTLSQDLYVVSVRSEWFDGTHFSQEFSNQVAVFGRNDVVDHKLCALEQDTACFGVNSTSSLVEHCRGKNILLLIHGMAKDWGQSNKDFFNLYQQSEEYLGDYDAVVAISWPGHVHWGIHPFVFANKHARRTGKRIRSFLENLTASAQSTDVITHSMGSKVFSRATKHSEVKVRNVVFLAPSIFRNNLKKGRRWGHVFECVSGRLICAYSVHDIAFSWSSLPHVGLGYSGMSVKNEEKYPQLTLVDCSAIIDQKHFRELPADPFKSRSNHSMYCQSDAVFEALQKLLLNPAEVFTKVRVPQQGVQ